MALGARYMRDVRGLANESTRLYRSASNSGSVRASSSKAAPAATPHHAAVKPVATSTRPQQGKAEAQLKKPVVDDD